MTDSRVLVVDDEEGPREAIRMILKPRYQVFTAGSGEEVLAVLPMLRPDVIFMDVKMPRMDGVQLLERVKALDPSVEVVMITAYASLDTVQRAMRFGAMDYLVKPFAPRELQEAAERALARRRQRLDGPGGALAPLIGRMRDLAQHRDPVQGGVDLAGLLRAILHEAQRMTGAAAASFLGTEPAVVVHSELPGVAGDAAVAAWRTWLPTVREAVGTRPGLYRPLPWPADLDAHGFEAAVLVPVADEGLPGSTLTSRCTTGARPRPGAPALAALRPVTDLMVTAVRTSELLTASARQTAEQSLRAVQGEILRQISTAVLVDPSLDRTLAAITEQLQQGAGYERVQVLLDPGEPAGADTAARAVFPLVAQGRRLGALVVETGRGPGSERAGAPADVLGVGGPRRPERQPPPGALGGEGLPGEPHPVGDGVDRRGRPGGPGRDLEPGGRAHLRPVRGRGARQAPRRRDAARGHGPARAGAAGPAGEPDGGAAPPGERPARPGADRDVLAHPLGRTRRERACSSSSATSPSSDGGRSSSRAPRSCPPSASSPWAWPTTSSGRHGLVRVGGARARPVQGRPSRAPRRRPRPRGGGAAVPAAVHPRAGPGLGRAGPRHGRSRQLPAPTPTSRATAPPTAYSLERMILTVGGARLSR